MTQCTDNSSQAKTEERLRGVAVDFLVSSRNKSRVSLLSVLICCLTAPDMLLRRRSNSCRAVLTFSAYANAFAPSSDTFSSSPGTRRAEFTFSASANAFAPSSDILLYERINSCRAELTFSASANAFAPSSEMPWPVNSLRALLI